MRPTASRTWFPELRDRRSRSRPRRQSCHLLCETKYIWLRRRCDTFVFEDFPNFGRNIWVFTADQARAHLDDGDFAAETTEHLSKLEPDIATADDDEMPWKKIDVHHRRVREIWNLIDARHIWDAGTATGIDEDFVGGKAGVADGDFFWIEARVSVNTEMFLLSRIQDSRPDDDLLTI